MVQVVVNALGKTVNRANPKYELYHPKWYRKGYSIFWWLEKPAYRKFMTRELTSLAVGYAVVLLMLQVWVLSKGQATYERFLDFLESTPVLIFHGVVLVFLLFHSVTWFNLAPKALVLRLGRRRIPDAIVLAGHYAAWLVATALVIWLVAT